MGRTRITPLGIGPLEELYIWNYTTCLVQSVYIYMYIASKHFQQRRMHVYVLSLSIIIYVTKKRLLP